MIHGMMLVRNEKNRKLQTDYSIFREVLEAMSDLCERLVICDDNSDDGTFELCQKYTKDLLRTNKCTWESNELEVRKTLWNKTISEVKHGDWIVCLDADEVIDNADGLNYMLKALPPHVDGLGFRLFDMWDMEHYREDEYWKAHFYPWTFAVRYDANKEYVWHEKALHCGRFPANASQRMLPTMIPVRHYGWALEEDRIKKYERYMRIDGDGKHGVLAQYQSILDKNPNLVRFGVML